MQAGDQALKGSAMIEAEALLRRGLNLVPSIPDGPARWQSELYLQIRLGRTLMARQGYSARAMGEAYDRARQLCDRLNGPPELRAVLAGLHSYHQDRADLRLALKLATELQELAEAADNPTARFTGYRLRGWTLVMLGDFAPARALLEQSLAFCDPNQGPVQVELGSPFAGLATVLGHLSWALALLGYLDQARSRNEMAVVEARRLSHAPTLANALSVSWRLGWLVRFDPATLLEYADELLAFTADYGLPYWHSISLVWRGWSLAALGRTDEGIALMTDALSRLGELGAAIYRPRILTLLAEAHAMAGQPQAGLARLDELERLTEARQVRWCQAESMRIRGALFVQLGDSTAGESSFRTALALARHQGSKLFELRVATSLARLWRDQGRFAEAHDLLSPVYDWFSEGFDTPDLGEAKALLSECPRRTQVLRSRAP
jgi:tetratricopeptide (TPR) repeat protein